MRPRIPIRGSVRLFIRRLVGPAVHHAFVKSQLAHPGVSGAEAGARAQGVEPGPGVGARAQGLEPGPKGWSQGPRAGARARRLEPGSRSWNQGPGLRPGTRAEARAQGLESGLGARGWSLEAGARAQGVEPGPLPKKGDFSIFCSGDLKVFVKIKDDQMICCIKFRINTSSILDAMPKKG